MRNIINVNENVKDKRKENIITVIIENDKINITVKNDTKLLRTMIGNQIGNVNDKMNREC